MADYGLLVEVYVDPRDTALTVAASVSDDELVVSDAGDFTEADGQATSEPKYLRLNGVDLEYLGIEWGVTEDDDDTILLATGLATAADEGDSVAVLSGGLPVEDWYAVVDMGDGDSVHVPLTFSQRALWAQGIYDPPVRVEVSDDHERIEDAPGRPPAGPGGRVNAWDQDMLTLEGPGEAVLTLTHTPLPMSLLAFWGTQFIPPSERTLSGNQVTFDDTDDAFGSGQEIWTWYLYDGAAPDTPVLPPPDPLLSFEASGWKWLQVARTDATDYSAPAFDDSGWATAAAAFGDGGDMAQPDLPAHATEWDMTTRMWARRTLTGLAVGEDIAGTIRADEASVIYLGGVQVWSGTPNGYEAAVTIDGSDVTSTSMVLAVRTTDAAGSLGCYFDLELGQ